VVTGEMKTRSAVANLIRRSGLAEMYKMWHCTLPIDMASGQGSATATRICWAGENRRSYTILVGDPEGKRQLARRRCGWDDKT
jgi:hypothetical protein